MFEGTIGPNNNPLPPYTYYVRVSTEVRHQHQEVTFGTAAQTVE